MAKLVRLFALVFVCLVVLGSTSVFATGDEPRLFSKGRGSNTSKLAADSCSGYCYPGASNCVSGCYCEGSLGCCTSGCGACCNSV